MRALWTIVRILVALLALGVTLVTPLFVSSPSGTTIDTTGAVIDAVAVIALVASAWSLWRDRARLF